MHSLDETAQQDLGIVDDILISYANFAGDEFCMFDIESARVMYCIIAMEEVLEFDHDEVVQTQESLSEIQALGKVNETGISDLTTMMKATATTMRETISNAGALLVMVNDTSTQVKTMAEQWL